jgi:hypothetical protein
MVAAGETAIREVMMPPESATALFILGNAKSA